MPVFLLAYLAPLLQKLSTPVIKWIAGGIAILLVIGVLLGSGFALGYHWEASAFEKYKANAAKRELELQHSYDAIGATVSKDYAAKLAVDLAETQRQLTELQSAPSRAVAAERQPDHSRRSVPVAAGGGPDDVGRIIRVLRSAAGR